MFLAIINDTYSEVKAEILAQRNEFEIVDYFKRLGNNIRGKIGKRDTKLDAEAAIKLAAADGQITYDELRENLQRSPPTILLKVLNPTKTQVILGQSLMMWRSNYFWLVLTWTKTEL